MTKNKAKSVGDWLDHSKGLMNLRTDRQLAIKLDVTRQAVAQWRVRGDVPPARAAHIEYATNKKVSWRELCPNLLQEIKEVEGR